MLFYNEAPIYLQGSYYYSNRPVGFTGGFQKLLKICVFSQNAAQSVPALAYFVAFSSRVGCKFTYLQ